MGARRCLVFAVTLVGIISVAPAIVLADPPKSVVSINLCADQLLVLLADRHVLRSVTFLSSRPSQSFVADLVRDIPPNYGEAEEVLAMQPDLVVAGRFAARPAVRMLRRLGIAVLDLPIPETFDEIRGQIVSLSSVLGVQARGDAMIEEMDRRLANIESPQGPPPRALVLGARGFTSGAETLVDEVLAAAGIQNVASDLGIRGYGKVELEEIVAAKPDVIIFNQPKDGAPSLASEALTHRALHRFDGQIIHMDPALWTCGGPYTIGAVEFLAAAVR
jgi:iron complex transport system substrate-binding protein